MKRAKWDKLEKVEGGERRCFLFNNVKGERDGYLWRGSWEVVNSLRV